MASQRKGGWSRTHTCHAGPQTTCHVPCSSPPMGHHCNTLSGGWGVSDQLRSCDMWPCQPPCYFCSVCHDGESTCPHPEEQHLVPACQHAVMSGPPCQGHLHTAVTLPYATLLLLRPHRPDRARWPKVHISLEVMSSSRSRLQTTLLDRCCYTKLYSRPHGPDQFRVQAISDPGHRIIIAGHQSFRCPGIEAQHCV